MPNTRIAGLGAEIQGAGVEQLGVLEFTSLVKKEKGLQFDNLTKLHDSLPGPLGKKI